MVLIMEDKLKCKTCQYCSFNFGNGSTNRYYCDHPDNPNEVQGIAGATLICRCGRGQSEQAKQFTRKTTPKWWPLNE